MRLLTNPMPGGMPACQHFLPGEGERLSEYHIIVAESTPQAGGMCMHMRLLADGLARPLQPVHVWSPTITDLNCESPHVEIHKTLGKLSIRDFFRTGKALDRFARPRRLLVYWVPHGYGWRGLNIWFCLWLWLRSIWRKDRVELLVQECFLPFKERCWRQNAAALVQRLMTVIVLRAADHVWAALSGYQARLKPYTLGKHVGFTWLPVPSNIAVVEDRVKIAEVRQRLAPGGFLMGHFGTFGSPITDLLKDILPPLLQSVDSPLVLLGTGGEAFRQTLLRTDPDLASRIQATGYLDDRELSIYLSACDVMIQPYPDGMTGRRGSALAPIAHGRPVITNATSGTEPLWAETGAVIFAPLTGLGFLNAVQSLQKNPAEANRVRTAAREAYLRHFDPNHMVEAIQAGSLDGTRRLGEEGACTKA